MKGLVEPAEPSTGLGARGALVFLFAGCLVLFSCAGPIQPGPGNQSPSFFSYQPLPTQPPVPLSVSTIDKFVFWVLTINSTQVDDVTKQIATVTADNSIVDAVSSRLSFANPGSVDHQLIYLSVLGEMKNERAITPLRDYVYSGECPVLEQIHQGKSRSRNTSVLDTCALLKSHAVSMISYINTPAAHQVVLQAISDHPSRAVRISAIDAFLYNAGDSPEAMQVVSRSVRPEERIFIGLPRLDPSTSLKEFDQRVMQFYREHPEQLPPPIRKEEQR
jgi:hypothetical protein